MVKPPYLIQRGKVKFDIDAIMPLSQAVEFDYIGASEFEWGAIPKAFLNLKARKQFLRRVRVKIQKKYVWVFHEFETTEQLDKYVYYMNLLACKKLNTHERHEFEVHFQQLEPRDHKDPVRDRILQFKNKRILNDQENTTFWWDIENNVMWTFDNDFASLFVDIIHNSFEIIKD